MECREYAGRKATPCTSSKHVGMVGRGNHRQQSMLEPQAKGVNGFPVSNTRQACMPTHVCVQLLNVCTCKVEVIATLLSLT